MANWEPVSRAIPSKQRSVRITDVAVADQIDFEDILGRPARGIKLEMTDATDVADFKLNSLVRIRKFNESQADETIKVWSGGGSTFRATGATEHVTQDGLNVSSIEIIALTLSSGAVIEIIAW